MVLRSLKQLHQLKKNQFLTPEELKVHQEKNLVQIVEHAYKNVSYYRTLFDTAGVRPNDINCLEDLYKIPITTKRDLQNISHSDKISYGTDVKKCVVKHTSGSTGQPLKIFLSTEERDFQILMNLRILMENGLRLRDKMAYIINPHRFPKSKYWFQNMGILRREYLSVFDYPQKHVEFLKRHNPEAVYGYPSNLTLLALYLKEKEIKGVNPKIMFSIAEALEPNARKMIDTIMKVNICDILGTIELGDIGWQCEERDGYHLSSDAVIVEFLKDGHPVKAGEEGRIVCTSLYQYTMPIIRYAVDDICIPSENICSCGRKLPMMESIKGRANDFIVLPDGQIIASCFLVIIMQHFQSIAQYRIVQKNKKGLLVQLVEGKGFNKQISDLIKKEIEKVTQNKLKIEIEIFQELPRDMSGKIRTVVSEVIPDLQNKIDEMSSLWIK